MSQLAILIFVLVVVGIGYLFVVGFKAAIDFIVRVTFALDFAIASMSKKRFVRKKKRWAEAMELSLPTQLESARTRLASVRAEFLAFGSTSHWAAVRPTWSKVQFKVYA